MTGIARKPKRVGASGSSGNTSRPELFDVSDLLPSEIDQLIERTLRDLPVADIQQREAHFKGEIERYRARRDTPVGGGVPEVDYTRRFYEAINSMPARFEEAVNDDAHQLAQSLVKVGIESGFLDHVQIAPSEYLRHLTGTGKRALYHSYRQHPEHGAELLRHLKDAGLDCPYDVTHVATLAAARPDHLHEPTIAMDGEHARSLSYAIAFAPRGPDEATRLLDQLGKAGAVENVKKLKGKTEPETPGRWRKPVIHSGIPSETLAARVANVRDAGDQHVFFFDDQPMPGYRAHEVFHHAEVRSAKKGLPVYVLDNPMAVTPTIDLAARSGRALPFTLTAVAQDGDAVHPLPAVAPPIDFWVPGAVLGRPVALKSLGVLAREAQLDPTERADLGAYFQVVGTCLKAIEAVHRVPPLADTVLVIGPRSATTASTLALSLDDVGGMASRLRLPTEQFLKACPSAGMRYGAALGAVAYDYLVASRAGWPRETLTPEEAERLAPLVAEALVPYGYDRRVALVVT